MDEAPRVRKLRWLCRRGMKELDVLLLRFVERESAALQAGGWPQFERLLAVEDDCLWDWVQSPQSASDSEFRDLLQALRS